MLTIVTWNTGKYRQISSLLEESIPCIQKNLELIEPQSNDMLMVSRHKATEAFQAVGWPVLVDDSGIYFSAYPNFPGVFSKYMFASLWREWLRRLFLDQPNGDAYFQCVLSYMDATLSEPKQFVGTVQGTIDFSFLENITPDEHLQYDSIFRAQWSDVVAQLDMTSFGKKHHRAQATKLCKEWLKIRK